MPLNLWKKSGQTFKIQETNFPYLLKKIIFATRFEKVQSATKKISVEKLEDADVVKLVDTLDLGSSAVRCVGSTPSIRTIQGLVSCNETFFIWKRYKNEGITTERW